MTARQAHRPVLLEPALEALDVHADGAYADGTYGRGGHSGAILARLGPAGRLLALDRDPEAVADARRRFGGDARFTIVHEGFERLGAVLDDLGLQGRLAGVLLDLGVSSPQLDAPERGFSFSREGPLDMRMDPGRGPSAADWLATATEREIAGVIRDYGEERHARRVARAIVQARAAAPLRTTGQLARVVAAAVPGREPGKHPATRTFQALRIRINRELEALEAVLPQAVAALAPGGRLVVISFHSLEDRIVKRFLRAESRGPGAPRGLPVRGEPAPGRLRLLGRAVRPDAAEQAANPRARSAVMRVAERT